MVGSSRWGQRVVSTKRVVLGGCSNILSSAFDASRVIRCACAIITTRCPCQLVCDTVLIMARTWSMVIDFSSGSMSTTIHSSVIFCISKATSFKGSPLVHEINNGDGAVACSHFCKRGCSMAVFVFVMNRDCAINCRGWLESAAWGEPQKWTSKYPRLFRW